MDQDLTEGHAFTRAVPATHKICHMAPMMAPAAGPLAAIVLEGRITPMRVLDNARKAGAQDRFDMPPGSAFDVDFSGITAHPVPMSPHTVVTGLA